MLSLFQVTCIVIMWKTAHDMETLMCLLNQAARVAPSMLLQMLETSSLSLHVVPHSFLNIRSLRVKDA